MSIEKVLPEHDILQFSSESLVYLGQSFSGREMWLERSDLVRHMLISGTTGSGKTEMLLSLAANAIFSGNGLVFVDGKGDIGTYAKIYALASKVGRTDDVMLLNFATPPEDGAVVSNTMNPLQYLSADAVMQILSSMLPVAGRDGEMWRGRAVAMMTAVVAVGVWQRDVKGVPLTFSQLRRLMPLREIVRMVSSDPGEFTGMPSSVRQALNFYLEQLPGYTAGAKISATSNDQHGYLTMQFTRIFSTMADTYGHVFDAPVGEIDMQDVSASRRILVVLLPSLAKSAIEISNLGGVVVTLLKNMMSEALISPVEGSWDDVVDRRSTGGEYPLMVIMDEASYYVAEGMAAMAGQARSLGFALIFATQDLGVLEEASKAEYNGIVANTGIKIVMSMQNPGDHRMSLLLPQQARYDNDRVDFEDRLVAEIAFRREQMNLLGGRGESPYAGGESAEQREAIAREVLGLTRAKRDLIRDNPNWTLVSTIKALRPGEFVVVRRGQFQRGRGVFMSAGIPKPDIRLAKGIEVVVDHDAIEASFEGPRKKKAFLQHLENLDIMTHLAPSDLTLSRVDSKSKGKRAQSVESKLQRSFAVLFSYPTLQENKPVPKSVSL